MDLEVPNKTRMIEAELEKVLDAYSIHFTLVDNEQANAISFGYASPALLVHLYFTTMITQQNAPTSTSFSFVSC